EGQPVRLLLLHQGADRVVLRRLEEVRPDFATRILAEGLDQRFRPQQATDVVRAGGDGSGVVEHGTSLFNEWRELIMSEPPRKERRRGAATRPRPPRTWRVPG